MKPVRGHNAKNDYHVVDDSPVICFLWSRLSSSATFWEIYGNTCPPSSSISAALPILLGNRKSYSSCVCLSLSTDSMIRVGGDYQAQIPEFKPGKLREENMSEKEMIEKENE